MAGAAAAAAELLGAGTGCSGVIRGAAPAGGRRVDESPDLILRLPRLLPPPHPPDPRSSVTETPEDAPVEPTEFVETEPGAECVVEQEENQGEPEVVFGHFYPAEPGAGEE
jgi:hypothetical protein